MVRKLTTRGYGAVSPPQSGNDSLAAVMIAETNPGNLLSISAQRNVFTTSVPRRSDRISPASRNT